MMIYHPETYEIKDQPMVPFISEQEIESMLSRTLSTPDRVRQIIAKSLQKQRLSMEETAVLLHADEPELVEEIKEGARRLKEQVYGRRIVLFAPLYVGNRCTNNCTYCGFRVSNRNQKRSTLTREELIGEVRMLEEMGQKRLILVFGEHPNYSPEFIALDRSDCVRS
jgi:2-iminoacetate synthase